MQELNNKMTGDQLTASEWNEPMSEIQNVILQSGQVLSGADFRQLMQSLTHVTGTATHFEATSDGSGDITLSELAGFGTIYALADGMRVRFYTTAATTISGAPSITVNGITKDFLSRDGSNISAGTYGLGLWTEAEYDLANDRWFTLEAQVGDTLGSVILATKANLESHDLAASQGKRALSLESWKHQYKRGIITSDFTLPDNGGGIPIETEVTPLTINLDVSSGSLTNKFYKVTYDLHTFLMTPTVTNDLEIFLDFGVLTADINTFQVSTSVESDATPGGVIDSVKRSVRGERLVVGAYDLGIYAETNGELTGGPYRKWRIEFIVNATGQPLKLIVVNGNTASDGFIYAGSQVTAELTS